jgi:HEAT repeat protein
MTTSQNNILRVVPSPVSQVTSAEGALAELYKALKAVSFYPAGHPLCKETMTSAHNSLQKLMAGKELIFVISRQGFTTNDGGTAVENNQISLSLAKELFVRRILRLTFLHDLNLRDLKEFLLILTLEPQKIGEAGGIASLMAERGISSIWANEIDLSVIMEKREALSRVYDKPLVVEEEELFDSADAVASPKLQEESDPPLEELISLMEVEKDDNQYQELGRMLVARADILKSEASLAPLLPVMEALLRQSQLKEKSLMQREYAVFTLHQIADGVTTVYLLQLLEEKDSVDYERIYPILKLLGGKAAYGIIQRICLTENLHARKSLANALVVIGPPAVPALLGMLKDERWYVVRNMVAIIGELRSSECLPGLRVLLSHSDQRVRKETVRSLMKIGGRDAEIMIVSLFEDEDPAIVRHAVFSLGIMRSQLAVQPLLEMVDKRDYLLKGLLLKKEAVEALGRIGDRRATPVLLKLLASGGWLVWNRWEELKIAIAITLGNLGDEAALPALKAAARRGDRLSEACSEAIDTIERLVEVKHG